MPRATAAQAAQTAQNVLDIAIALFAARGYSDVALDDVATQAGVTRGAVYHHFGSKAGLLQAAVEQLQARVASQVVAVADGAGQGAGAQLRAGCHAFLDAATAEPVGRILLLDAPAVIGWQQWRESDANNSALHLRQALESTGLAGADLEAATAQLSGAMNEAALWLAEHGGENPDLRASAHRMLDRLLGAFIDLEA